LRIVYDTQKLKISGYTDLEVMQMFTYPLKARKQFEAGKILFEKGYYNDALSRFYYALRSIAIFVVGAPKKGKWKHPALMKMFTIEVDRRGLFELSREERHLIKRFPNEREKADYDLVEVSRDRVERYIQLVERILREVTTHVEGNNQN